MKAMNELIGKMDAQTAQLTSKLDLANVQLESERHSSKVVLRRMDCNTGRVTAMANESSKLRTYATQKCTQATMDPANKELSHGFAIAVKRGLDRNTGKELHHFTIVAGQKRYVTKAIEGRDAVIGFTYIANPIDYRNNVSTRIQERLSEIAEVVNAELAVEKARRDVNTQSRIIDLEQERRSADDQYTFNLRAWTNPEAVKRELNA